MKAFFEKTHVSTILCPAFARQIWIDLGVVKFVLENVGDFRQEHRPRAQVSNSTQLRNVTDITSFREYSFAPSI